MYGGGGIIVLLTHTMICIVFIMLELDHFCHVEWTEFFSGLSSLTRQVYHISHFERFKY